MSLSQPGSVTAAGSHAQPPAFASQPGTATAAAAAQFVPPPELAAAGAGGYAAGYADAQVGGGAAARYGGGYGEGQAGGANPEGGSGGAYGDPEGGGSFGAAAALPLSCSGDAEGGGGGGAHEYHAGGYGGGEASVEAATEAAAGDGGATAEASGAYNPAEYLQQLEAHLGALHLQRRDLEGQLVAAATSGYQAMSARLSGAGAGVPLGSNVPALVDELAVLQSARQYLAYLQELQALTRHVDKSVRALQQQQQQQAAGGGGGADPAAFVAAASEAVDSFSNSVGYAIAVRQLTGECEGWGGAGRAGVFVGLVTSWGGGVDGRLVVGLASADFVGVSSCRACYVPRAHRRRRRPPTSLCVLRAQSKARCRWPSCSSTLEACWRGWRARSRACARCSARPSSSGSRQRTGRLP